MTLFLLPHCFTAKSVRLQPMAVLALPCIVASQKHCRESTGCTKGSGECNAFPCKPLTVSRTLVLFVETSTCLSTYPFTIVFHWLFTLISFVFHMILPTTAPLHYIHFHLIAHAFHMLSLTPTIVLHVLLLDPTTAVFCKLLLNLSQFFSIHCHPYTLGLPHHHLTYTVSGPI